MLNQITESELLNSAKLQNNCFNIYFFNHQRNELFAIDSNSSAE